MENVRKHIKLITTERTRNYLVIKFFIEKLLAREIKKNKPEILMKKLVHLGLSILELSKILMYGSGMIM